MKEEIDNKLKQINSLFKKHADVFEEYKKLIKETHILIFKDNCLKPYLSKCEPEFCSFRISGECNYFEKLNQLISITHFDLKY